LPEICSGQQSFYSLPEWPSTEVEWTIINNNTGFEVLIVQTDQRNTIALFTEAISGNFTLKANYRNTLLGCTGQATIDVSVKPSINIILEENIICRENELKIQNTLNLMVNYAIYNQNNQFVASIEGSTVFHILNYEPGNYYITIHGNINFCFTNKKWFQIIAKPENPIGIIGEYNVCTGITYIYQIENPVEGLDYSWNLSSEGATFVGSSFGNYVYVTFSNPNVELSVRAINFEYNCQSEDFILNISPFNLNGYIEGDAEVCSSSTSLYDVKDILTNQLHHAGDEYIWTLSNPNLGSISVGQLPSMVEILWNHNSQIQMVDIQLQIIKCNTQNTFITKTVEIKPIPEIFFDMTIDDPVICGSVPFELTILPTNSNFILNNQNTTVRWTYNGQSVIGGPTHSIVFYNFTDENVLRYVKATIVNFDGCEATSNEATFYISVMPNNNPTLTLTIHEFEFCSPNEINTTLTCSSLIENSGSIFNNSYQWFHNGNLITGAVNNTYEPNQFGVYSCQVTHGLSGCVAITNTIEFLQKNCSSNPGSGDNGEGEGGNCNISIQNTSIYDNCGGILLSAATNASEVFYTIQPTGVGSITNNVFTAPPGLYSITVRANDVNCNASDTKLVLIPFAPNLNYTATCSTDLNIIQTQVWEITNMSEFFPLLENRQQSISFIHPNTGQSIHYTYPIGYFDMSINGSLNITVANSGTYNGVNYHCEKIFTIHAMTVPDLTLKFTPPQITMCHDTPVEFSFDNEDINLENFTYIWEFETGITNTVATPMRVFNEPGNYNVKVKVSNELGCGRQFDVNVHIPPPCFEGYLQATPNTMLCEGEAITISYVSNTQNCNPKYLWMHNDTPLEFFNQSSITVTQPGYYWLMLERDFGGCNYRVPNGINAQFVKKPFAKILVNDTYCEEEEFEIKAIVPNDNFFEFSIVGTNINSANSNLITSLSPGVYQVQLQVYGTTCDLILYKSITIIPKPTNLSVTASLISCTPYTYQLTANANHATQFLWSNGLTGNQITVTQGGAYQVTAKSGDCSINKTIVIPKHPSAYTWSFPTGCLNLCDKYQTPYVLGPIAVLEHQLWVEDNSGVINHHVQEASAIFDLINDGQYNALIYNSGCEVVTKELNFVKSICEECKIRVDKKIKIEQNTNFDFCVFDVFINIVSEYSYPISITINDANNLVIVLPATITLQPGFNQISFKMIPITNTGGGEAFFVISGNVLDDNFSPKKCQSYIPEVKIPNCQLARIASINSIKPTESKTKIIMYPNPANHQVYLQWQDTNDYDTFRLFDLQGKLLIETNLQAQTSLTINTSKLTEGIYIATISKDGVIIEQRKLIKRFN
jgi:hypothetical protein